MLRKFTIHLPADDGSMTLAVDDAYVAVLEGLLRGPLSVRCRFHGKRMHPRVAEIVKRGRRGDLHTRAGNLANQPKPTWLRGEITCGWRIANQPRNPLRLSSLVILGVVARMSRCATRSSYWFT